MTLTISFELLNIFSKNLEYQLVYNINIYFFQGNLLNYNQSHIYKSKKENIRWVANTVYTLLFYAL